MQSYRLKPYTCEEECRRVMPRPTVRKGDVKMGDLYDVVVPGVGVVGGATRTEGPDISIRPLKTYGVGIGRWEIRKLRESRPDPEKQGAGRGRVWGVWGRRGGAAGLGDRRGGIWKNEYISPILGNRPRAEDLGLG